MGRFEDLITHLRRQDVTGTVKSALQRLHRLCHQIDPEACAELPASVNVRVFVSSELIHNHSDKVFEDTGVLERNLIAAAAEKRELFFNITRQLSSGVPFSQLPRQMVREFPRKMSKFFSVFRAWKIPDEERLVGRIMHALEALYAAYHHLDEEQRASQIGAEFQSQTSRLRSKLLHIAGPAKFKEFDEDHPCPPQLLAEVPETNTIDVNTRAIKMIGEMKLSNERIAHELLLDPQYTYTMEAQPYDTDETEGVRSEFRRAFWNSLTDDLMLETPCFTRAIRVMREIYDGVEDLQSKSLPCHISGMVNIEAVCEKARSGNFTWPDMSLFLNMVIGVINETQAECLSIDTENKWAVFETYMKSTSENLAQARVFCMGLELLLDRVNAMRVHAVNCRLRIIQPVLRDHGINYERQKFNEKIERKLVSVEDITSWLEPHFRVATNKTQLVDDPESLRIFICKAVLDTVYGDTTAPTLALDSSNLKFARRNLAHLANAGALVYTLQAMNQSSSFIGGLVEKTVNFFNKKDVINPELSEYLAALTDGVGVNQERRLMSQFIGNASDIFNGKHEAKLMMERGIYAILHSYITSSGADREIKIGDLAVLYLFAPRLFVVAKRVHAVANLNYKVHRMRYRGLIANFLYAMQTVEPAVDHNLTAVQAPLGVFYLDGNAYYNGIVVLPYVITLELADRSIITIAFAPDDPPIDRFCKANIGLIHVERGSFNQAILGALLTQAAAEGGFVV